MNTRKKDVVIVGAGPAGLFAARALKKQGINPTIIEKEANVGGKCKTYTDSTAPEIKTEWGAAMLAPNYGVVLDAVNDKEIEFEESIGTQRNSIEILQKLDALSLTEQAYFATGLISQLARFTYDVTLYHEARDNCQPLPEDFDLPFSQYAEKYGLEDINLLAKPLVTGFGYGAMQDIPAYCVMEYMGVGTIPALALEKVLNKSALVAIKGGTQHLMERVAEDFNVITSANITAIDRSPEKVNITYTVNGITQQINADALVLAISPLQWAKLGMKLTDVEQECIDQLNYYRYPVAVCKVDGLSPEHAYVPEALEREGFGHMSLVTTRDNRPTPQNGRLCTAYFNLPPGKNNFSLDEDSAGRKTLLEELNTQHDVQNVKILGTKIWEDYMPTLPWAQRLKLDGEQMREDTHTLYVGAYPVGGFEDIRCVADQSTRAVNKHILDAEQDEDYLSYATKEIGRAFRFFYSTPRVQPAETGINLDADTAPKLA